MFVFVLLIFFDVSSGSCVFVMLFWLILCFCGVSLGVRYPTMFSFVDDVLFVTFRGGFKTYYVGIILAR